MKKVYVVLRWVPNPDLDGGEVKIPSAHGSKKKAELWLENNEEKYKEDWCNLGF